MKNFINTIKAKATDAKNKLLMATSAARTELADETGANHHIDVSIWVIIGCVIGALMLGLLTGLITNVVMPGVTESIEDLFNV